jgi:NAD-dependent deacetylase
MLAATIAEKYLESSNIILLTGAGISEESGIPTFRGYGGYWSIGSKNYFPEELATYNVFMQIPEHVWAWYHHRRNLCKSAEPNAGHHAIKKLETIAIKHSKSFHLVTQNVDGLHLKAGADPLLTYQIHGNLHYMRCLQSCTSNLYPIPDETTGIPKCPNCGKFARPHVLWFDETYNELYYGATSVLKLANAMNFLVIIGTTLKTSLPYKIAIIAANKSIPIVKINPEPLDELAGENVVHIPEKSGSFLPKLLAVIESTYQENGRVH